MRTDKKQPLTSYIMMPEVAPLNFVISYRVNLSPVCLSGHNPDLKETFYYEKQQLGGKHELEVSTKTFSLQPSAKRLNRNWTRATKVALSLVAVFQRGISDHSFPPNARLQTWRIPPRRAAEPRTQQSICLFISPRWRQKVCKLVH